MFRLGSFGSPATHVKARVRAPPFPDFTIAMGMGGASERGHHVIWTDPSPATSPSARLLLARFGDRGLLTLPGNPSCQSR